MKKYETPNVSVKSLMNKNNISSLGEWLSSGAGVEYQDAGVVTYVMLSE